MQFEFIALWRIIQYNNLSVSTVNYIQSYNQLVNCAIKIKFKNTPDK